MKALETACLEIIRKFDSEGVDGDPEALEDYIDDVMDKIKVALCESMGSHEWVFDQCGFWQHQFCGRCNEVSKYPDLAKKRCYDLVEEMGKMTEVEYLSRRMECGE